MRSLTRILTPAAIAVAVLLLAVVVVPVSGVRTLFAPPTVVVTVNLSTVLENLEERAAAEQELQKMAETILAEDERWQEELKAMRQRLDDTPGADAAAVAQLEEEIALRALEYQGWRRYNFELLDIEKSLLLRQLYRSIKASLAALCDAQGYDIVLLDDSQRELTVNAQSGLSNEDQVKQQMTSRRVLHARDAVDITDELVERMNNAF